MQEAGCVALALSAQTRIDQAQPIGLHRMTRSSTSGPQLIAVVDDDHAIRCSFIALLESAGYQVVCFPTAARFLSAAPNLKLACVLLDLHLADIDGINVLKRLGEMENHVPAILMAPRPRTRTKAYDLGAHLVLDKPIEEARLFSAIGTALHTCPDPQT